MDRAQAELLVKAEPYIQHNISVAEFVDKIEPAIGREAARRLRLLVGQYLDWPMPDLEGEGIPAVSGDDD